MKLLIGGDVCPLGRNEQIFINPSSIHSLRQLYDDTDIMVVNLECPLISHSTPIVKGGPVLGADVESVAGLKKLGVDIVGLSNNHIMDHGTAGLKSTIEALKNVGIEYVGAGVNVQQASQPLLKKIGDTQVAILAFAEREYSHASSSRPGACPLDSNLVVRALRAIPEDTISVVLVHGGNEYYPYPSPWLQDTCRLMVELGANIVICQHSHCIGTYEVYQDALIVYGQGNMIFDLPSKYPGWWEGLLVGAEFANGKLVGFNFIPVRQDPGKNVILQIVGDDRTAILDSLDMRSKVLKDKKQLEMEWERFCQEKKRMYQTLLFGLNRVLHLINKFTGIADLVSRSGQMNIGNALRCASHVEVLKTLYSMENTTKRMDHEK